MGQSQQVERQRRRVLVIDDEPLMGTTLRMALADDHDVQVVSSGAAGAEVLARDPHFDVVLCDLMMPGVSGIELHTDLARRMPRLAERFIFMSGGAYTQEASDFLDRVHNRHLQKPFDIDELLRIVGDVSPLSRPVTGRRRALGDAPPDETDD